MMIYPYEDLGPERVQELCQALLTQLFPRLQYMPIAMRDGGAAGPAGLRGANRIQPHGPEPVPRPERPSRRRAL